MKGFGYGSVRVAMIRCVLVCAGSGIVALASADAQAHHSPAQFDLDKLASVTGTVAKLQWTNPHVFIQLLVADASGKATEWSLEAPNPAGLNRAGWHSDTLKPGDKVTVDYNPLRAGGPAGFMLAVTLASGKKLGQTDIQEMRVKDALAASKRTL
jgi:hypothetical protein